MEQEEKSHWKGTETVEADREKYEKRLRLVTNRMLGMKNEGVEEQFPISLIDIDCWEWPQGVGLYGLCKYYMETKDEDIFRFLIKWYDDRLQEGILERNVNTTAPMLTLTYLYEMTGREEYRYQIEDWAAWIMSSDGLIKTGDGCFQHMITKDPNTGEILIDTLFMAVLFLARAGYLLKDQKMIDEANYQMMSHIKYLLNKEEGLFYHGFSFIRNDNYGRIMWGRGNSWYTVAVLDYLEMVDVDPCIRRYLLSVYKNQVKALKKYADPESGLWHTIINDSDSYIELSASAGFLCGILHGIRTGVLEREEYSGLVEKALEGMMDYIDKDGTVLNVSYGTPIGEDAAFYKNIRCCPMTYGQAMMIMALQEAMLYVTER